jgi:3-phosphoshikimate 1-carboxyvinyltransferase
VATSLVVASYFQMQACWGRLTKLKFVVRTAHCFKGDVTLPGDKSISHRALMLGILANGTTFSHNWLNAGATEDMVNCIRALGGKIEVHPSGPSTADLVVYGKGLEGFTPPSEPVFCGRSATTLRFLMGVLATQSFTTILDGDEILRRRPMERVAQPLRQMGAIVETTDGYAPVTVTGGRLTAIDYTMPVPSGSLQTALLLAALGAQGRMILRQLGPVRDHTVRMLGGLGARIQEVEGVITFDPKGYPFQPLDCIIPGDMSSAAFLITAALIVSDSELILCGVNTNHTRTGLVEVLQTMGGHIEFISERYEAGEPIADMIVRGSRLQGTEVSGEVVVRMIDEFPIFTVAALMAHGKTLVRNAEELRIKDSDRIEAMIEELSKLGAEIIPHADGFVIFGPQSLSGAVVSSHRDHRLAMSLAIAGLVASGETIIERAEELNTSFPNFVEILRSLGVEIEVFE